MILTYFLILKRDKRLIDSFNKEMIHNLIDFFYTDENVFYLQFHYETLSQMIYL